MNFFGVLSAGLWLLGLLGLPEVVHAQTDDAFAWHTVWLDSTASVQLPYASSQPMPEAGTPLVRYHTGTSDNQFYALALALEGVG